MKRKQNNDWELRVLKAIILLYIFLCLVIAGLNYGLDQEKYPEIHSLIVKIWHFYENQFKTGLIILGSVLTLRIAGKRSRELKKNLIGFILAALVIHIAGPLLLNNYDLYFFSMPAPWSSTAFQLLSDQSDFNQRHLPLWGAAGFSALFIFYISVTGITYLGTLLLGRRWQCSTICLFNGFISECFSPAFPFSGKKKNLSKNQKRLFTLTKVIMLLIAVFFTSLWIEASLRKINPELAKMAGEIEIMKYLSLELLAAMFFWVAFTGRGYCYYCPLGTVLGVLGKWSGQKIKTDKSNCINCQKCDSVCPMNIEISTLAQEKKDIININCVGCRHCVDACPTRTLEYTTHFLDRIKK